MSTSVVTLVTGLQGNGKTLFTIDAVKRLAESEGRAVYYHGITELALPWTPLENPEDWPDVPSGSIVVLDEAQKAYRLRANGAAVPRHVSELETLRHRGISLWLITQHPMLIDNNARRLCGRHLHLVRKFGGQSSMLHEWNAVRENCDKPAGRRDSIKRTFKFPKSVFSLYKSAEVHTVKRKIPTKVLALVPMVAIALGVFGYVGYRKVVKPLEGEGNVETVQKAPHRLGEPLGASGGGQGRGDKPMTTAEYVQAYTPRIAGLDYTAPVYDSLTQPKRVPVPAACVTSKTKCQCYTQQGTKLSVGPEQCAQIVRDGFFMAFEPDSDARGREHQGEVATSSSLRPPSAVDLQAFPEG
ncbi:zonular occludens toxin domain-containing protein [Cupriavidus plantarum]|uniref:zonular occludens toxin domain-containing protein n=1 Tax=Cupriavidus plantarum TaxID=942865 RepID=UPI00339D85A2